MPEYKTLKEVDLTLDVFKLKHKLYPHHRDEHVRTFFEKAFNTQVKAAFVEMPSSKPDPIFPNKGVTHTDLDYSYREVVLFFENGRITSLHCSEWGEIETTN